MPAGLKAEKTQTLGSDSLRSKVPPPPPYPPGTQEVMSVVTLSASGQEPPVTHQEHIKCSLLSREDLKVLWEAFS